MESPPSHTELVAKAEASLQVGNFAVAERIAEQALTEFPGDVSVRILLAVAVGLMGRIDESLDQLREVLAVEPENPSALRWTSSFLRKQGDLEGALPYYLSLARLTPHDPFLQNEIGTLHFERGRFNEAAVFFGNATNLKPDEQNFRQNLNLAVEHRGQRQQDGSGGPSSTDLNLARRMLSQGNAGGAIASLQRAIEKSPLNEDANIELALALKDSGRLEESAEVLRDAVAVQPDCWRFHNALGAVLRELGRFEEAVASYEKAIALQPRLGSAFLGICGSITIKEDRREFLHRMEILANMEDLPWADKRDFYYALAKAYDDLGDYGAAMRHYDLGTEVVTRQAGQSFDIAAITKAADLRIKTYTKAFFKSREGFGIDSQIPVFIVGAPRSGTTLLEQILSCHKSIGAGGELLYWFNHEQAAIAAISDSLNTPSKALDIATEYRQLLRGLAPKKPRVTDKMPSNFFRLGVIHTLLPGAHIIHVRRNPVDTCLSIYMNAAGMRATPFGYSREDIVAGFREYQRLMEHWRQVLPTGRLLEIDYEELVADREKVIRDCLNFLGVEWDEACLQHEENKRAVQTPSRWQVRQPIYATSVARWKRYEPWLGAFRELLE